MGESAGQIHRSREVRFVTIGKSPAFSVYVNEWLGSPRITLMLPEEEGAYFRLLCYAWGDPDCSLPDDDEVLARLSRLGDRWLNGCSTAVRACFEKHPNKPGRIYNPRLFLERKKQERNKKQKAAAGVKSGEARRYKSNRRSTETEQSVHDSLNLSASASASNSRSKDLLSDRDRRAQSRKPKAGVFSKLTEAELRDSAKLQAWYEYATRQKKPIIEPSSHHRLMVFGAAEQAFQGDNPVGLFAWIVSGKRWDAVKIESERAGSAKIKALDHPSPDGNGFSIDPQAFNKANP